MRVDANACIATPYEWIDMKSYGQLWMKAFDSVNDELNAYVLILIEQCEQLFTSEHYKVKSLVIYGWTAIDYYEWKRTILYVNDCMLNTYTII